MRKATRCVHISQNGGDDPYGAIVPPIYQTATFRQRTATEFDEYDYTRSGNPTRTILERQLAGLEGGKHACAFGSGMAAITALTRLLHPGDEIVAGNDLYGGTVRLFDQILPRQGTVVHYVDTTNLSAVQQLLSSRTKLILMETPSNPLLQVSDIEALAELAHSVGAILAVDNSMLSPCLQQPLDCGADVVIHSATKFLSGHSDLMAGALITNDEFLHERVAFQQKAEGAGLSPFESWLLMRGMKTLALRVEKQNASAQVIAERLTRFAVARQVYYPGLDSHPGYELNSRQAKGAGAVIGFTTGDPQLSIRIVEAARLFEIAVSFGSVGSVISLPCRMSHASIPESLRGRLAPSPDLIRLSIGIEDVDDLIEDLQQAVLRAVSVRDKRVVSLAR
jgi:cystathionine beta-lyase